MSHHDRHKFTLISDTSRKYQGFIRPDRNGEGVFIATYPVRGVIPLDKARAFADTIHDICDELEDA